MIIDIQPTPRLRRHRGRLVGGTLAVLMLATSFASVAELASAADPTASHAPVSDARP